MKNTIKFISDASLYLSIMLVVIMTIGYVLGITIICSSLAALLQITVMTVAKVIMYFVIWIMKTINDVIIMTITTIEVA